MVTVRANARRALSLRQAGPAAPCMCAARCTSEAHTERASGLPHRRCVPVGMFQSHIVRAATEVGTCLLQRALQA